MRIVKKIDLTRYFPHILFSICTLIYIFTISGESDMLSVDARFNAALANYQFSDVGRSLSLRADFLFGNGTLQWGYLWWIEPTTLVGSIFGHYNYQLVNFVFSLLIFSLTEVFLRQLEVPRLERILASALCAITTMWGYSIAIVDNGLFAHVPQFASQYCLTLSLLIVLNKFQNADLKKSILLGLFILLNSVYLLVVFPQIFVTAIPFLVSVVLGSWIVLLKNKRITELLRSFLLSLVICLFLFFLKANLYLLSFYTGNSAVEVPLTNFPISHTRNPKVVLFESFFAHLSGKSDLSVQWFCFYAILIFIAQGLFIRRFRNLLWLTVSVSLTFLVIYNLWQRSWIYEQGPRQNYVAWSMAPLFVVAVVSVLSRSLTFLRKFRSFSMVKRQSLVRYESLFVLMPLLVVFSPLSSLSQINDDLNGQSIPAVSSVPSVVNDVSFIGTSDYRGRVAFLGSYINYQTFIDNRIPLLNDYSHNLSPLAYRFHEKFFLDSDFGQWRNHFKFGPKNLNLYELVGVKYLLASLSFADEYLVDREDIQFVQKPSENKVGVIELVRPNLGNFSPVNALVADNLRQTYQILSTINLRSDVVLLDEPKMSLQAARESKMTVVDGDLRVIASSAGDSVLVLPFEFSSCINFEEKSEKSNFIRAELANGLLTAVFFSKNLDLTISYRLGLFENQDCRLKDLELYRSITEDF